MAGSRPPARRSGAASLLFASLVLAVSWIGLKGPLRIHGDGMEYIIQTQAIVLHRELRIDPARVTAYWDQGNPFGTSPRLEADKAHRRGHAWKFGGLYRDLKGDWRYYHFWGYSLAVAPLYELFHRLERGGDLEYRSFGVFNLLCLLLPFILAWLRRPGWPLLGASCLLLFSPLLPYVDWQHPELFCFCLICLAFFMAGVPWLRYLSPLPLGLAAAQVPPAVFFFLPHLAWVRKESGGAARGGGWFWSYLAAGLVVLAPPAYFKYHFGVWSLIQKIGGASLGNTSIARALDIFVNPFFGAVWFFPAVFLFLTACLGRRNAFLSAVSLASAFLAAWLAGATGNLNSGHVGAVRHAVWILAPLTFIILDADWRPGAFRRLLYLAVAGACIFWIGFFHLWHLPLKRTDHFHFLHRLVPDTARLLRRMPYRGDMEALVENILGRELAAPWEFNGVYIWNLGPDRSLWVISRRALRQMRYFYWPTSGLPPYEARPSNKLFARGKRNLKLLPGGITRFERHPRWGDYLLATVGREVRQVRTNVPLYIVPRPSGGSPLRGPGKAGAGPPGRGRSPGAGPSGGSGG